jgi:ketosteroid isomerase-like protein
MTSQTSQTSQTSHSNADTVKALYAAFGRGDLPTILDALADDVAWESWPDHSAQRAGVAHLMPRRGPAEVADFFAELAAWTPNAFEVRDVIGTGRKVVADVAVDFTLPGGGRLVDEELHLWTFDDAGQVAAFRHYCDTAKHIAAIAPLVRPGARS